MKLDQVPLLICPKSKKRLRCENAVMVGERIRSGILTDGENRYPVVDYIPRFTPENNYCSSFSLEWEKHPEILYGKYSNYSVYKDRFYKETRWGNRLEGQLVLEAGCGPGAFTPYALETGATVISFDASQGVEKSYQANGHNEKLLILQASIYDMPFPDEFFDRIFCFGVLQHTPDPRRSFTDLVSKLKPGGSIACDIYSVPLPDHPYTGLLRTKYCLRRFTAGRDPEKLHRLISSYVNIAWPLSRIVRKLPRYGIQMNRRLLLDDYETRLSGMDVSMHREFATLDIFDMLSPNYDIPAEVQDFKKWHEEAGLDRIDVHFGYNGIEGRGVKRNGK